jgi:lysophospholipase L1-like esterase
MPPFLCRAVTLITVTTTIAYATIAEPFDRSPAAVQQASVDTSSRWITTWAASPQFYSPSPTDTPLAEGLHVPDSITNQTIRQIVHISAGGRQVRLRLSNEFGTTPLVIGEASLALSAGSDKIKQGSIHPVTFGGRPSVVLAPGAPLLSDPILIDVPPLSDLAISLYLPDATKPETIHMAGLQTAYVSAGNNVVADTAVSHAATFMQRFFLSSVEVQSTTAVGTIVTLGDSITDGGRSTPNTNRRWPDLLANRLASKPGLISKLAVANAGIGGNALLHSAVYGGPSDSNPSALARFDRDVLALAGVRYVILMEGVNDLDSIGLKVNGKEVDNPMLAASAEDIISGYQQIIARAHTHGIKIIGTTIMPYEGEGMESNGRVTLENAYSTAKENMRELINRWVLGSRAFDGVIDFDSVVRDPTRPTQLLPAYDSGDHIHPNDAGTAAMASSINLSLLR